MSKIFDAFILGKYKTDYFQCENCSFIQTDKPHWLNEAYASAMTAIDVGLISRNIHFSNVIPATLDIFSDEHDAYLDYGGGYGIFVRIMRDKGYDFYLQDRYAENLFAKSFEVSDYTGAGKFAAVTAFEVFEHLEEPIAELQKILELSDTIIFSTDLLPKATFSTATDWWYFAPETGQHISFYSKRSLEIMAARLDCNFYTNEVNLHILSKRRFVEDPFLINNLHTHSRWLRLLSMLNTNSKKKGPKRSSLLQKDFELYKDRYLNNSKQ